MAKGQAVCVVETQKASVELEAPGPGTIVRLYDTGAEVELGRAVAVVCETAEELAQQLEGRAQKPAAAPAPERKATRKAVELAERHGIDLESIDKRGFITERDVEALIGGVTDDGPAPDGGPLEGVSTERVTLPALLSSDEGAVDESFLDGIRADPDAFRALGSDEQCRLYREHGARIGEGVDLGEGTLLVAPRVVIEDAVAIGAGATIVCDGVLTIGALSHFGPGLELRCRRAHLGSGIHAGRQIRIGGGGHRDPWALVAIGDSTFVGDEVYVNACRPVLIGTEAFLTMRSLIVTHNIGHSLLEGFENRFAPVVLEDRALVGLGTVVYAGCRIGEGSVVGSNSYVVSDIPPGKLAMGVPARVIGSAQRSVSRAQQVELVHGIVQDLHELLVLRGHPARLLDGDEPGLELDVEAGPSRVRFVERLDARDLDPAEIVLTLELAGEPRAGGVVIDLLGRRIHGAGEAPGPLVDAVREFCRKRGIRLRPGPWRYRGGLV